MLVILSWFCDFCLRFCLHEVLIVFLRYQYCVIYNYIIVFNYDTVIILDYAEEILGCAGEVAVTRSAKKAKGKCTNDAIHTAGRVYSDHY